ncbi:MAG: Gfo/Idh/MocA family oxidoreductase, partial [Nitrospirota bacterium]|nr:Gfo/Idh/MocA family oxidoreductase [Nitrospirota bacterium]
MTDKVRILVVGVGNMGASHAKAYHKLDGYEIAGLMSRTIEQRTDLPAELASYPRFADFDRALAETRPDAVSINTYPNTHADYAIRAMDAGCHVFMEKPIATNYDDAVRVVDKAKQKNKK